MKILYLDCSMGAAGDMLTASLLELLPNPDEFIDKLNALKIPNIEFIRKEEKKCGIMGTSVTVKVGGEIEGEEHHHHTHEHHDEHSHEHTHHHHHVHDHTHHHSSMHDIEHIVSSLPLKKEVKEDILAIYNLIAEAESHAHGEPVSKIHFHEVGQMDAIADITAVCMLLDEISADKIIVSPINVGSGFVRCAHGILPVPAPATSFILKDVPIYSDIKGELCTPTGAAILKHFATSFEDMPVMKVESIGYGMGKKDFERANILRAMLGKTEDKTDTIIELSCNVDDMTAESISYACKKLFKNGALEVFTVPVYMKKSRMGTLIKVMCKGEAKEDIVNRFLSTPQLLE